MTEDETYLGDAVFASLDGYQIWLRTDDGNNQRIALEPKVFHALLEIRRNPKDECARMTDPQREIAMLVRSIRSAADDLRALKLWFAQDDIYALDAAGVDIEQLIRPRTRTELKGTQHG